MSQGDEYVIEQLVRRERYYRDMDDWDSWRDCYHPDSSKTYINISWSVPVFAVRKMEAQPGAHGDMTRFKGEIDEFVTKSKAIKAIGVAPLHTVTPVDIQVRDTRAVSVASAEITTWFEDHGKEFNLVAQLRLISRLEKVDSGDWKMLSLEGLYLHDRIQPVGAVTSENAAEIKAALKYLEEMRPSYHCLMWDTARKDAAEPSDKPAVDQPESVRSVLDACKLWLEDDEDSKDETDP